MKYTYIKLSSRHQLYTMAISDLALKFVAELGSFFYSKAESKVDSLVWIFQYQMATSGNTVIGARKQIHTVVSNPFIN